MLKCYRIDLETLDVTHNMTPTEPLLPKHGGYRKLKSFQVARLIYDLTVRFDPLYRKAQPDPRPDGAGGAVRCSKYRRRQSGLGNLEKDRTQTHQRGAGQPEELRLDYEVKDFLRLIR